VTRRIVVIIIYNVLFFFLAGILDLFVVSQRCLKQNICTNSEQQFLSLIGFAVMTVGVIIIGLGWTGRLPWASRRR
jgi:hypothetical protein